MGGAVPPAPAGRGGEVRARGGRERQQAQGSDVSSPYHCSNFVNLIKNLTQLVETFCIAIRIKKRYKVNIETFFVSKKKLFTRII